MMKKWLAILVLMVVTTASEPAYFYYSPILMERADLETSVSLNSTPKPISDPGKLCLYRNWVLLVENYKGVHLIDNSDPANPVRKAFLTVPGCMEVAVHNDVCYVNNAVDLVGVKVDFEALTATPLSRLTGVLPALVNPRGYIPEVVLEACNDGTYVIVGWISVSSTTPYNQYYYE
jgi:hypothetical protein